jgi:succinoglycan biosynthesis protein ExoA
MCEHTLNHDAAPAHSRQLDVSVLIPMRNEARYIGPCLDSVLANSFPEDRYEILVMDGDSTDGSRDVVLLRANQHPCIRLLRNPARVVPPGMNIGIRQAQGRYIIRMDAHSEYPKDYIENCVTELERTGAANVGGRWITRPGGDSAMARAIALFTQTRVGIGNAAYRLGEGDRYVDTVPFGAFRRELFDRIGLYREDLVRHQDYELNARIREAGYPIYLSSKIYNVYYNVGTFRKFMRQAWMNGMWNPRAWVRYPISFCWRHAAPLAFAGGLLTIVLAGILMRPMVWIGGLVLAIYLTVAACLAITIGFRGGWKTVPYVLILMPSYHFVYGFASILGLFRALATSRTAISGNQERSFTSA